MPTYAGRPAVMGRNGAITSGHHLASVAGFHIMEQGGNAVDAAAAVSFCLNLLEPHQNGMGGEAPTLIYSANDKKVFAVSGMGWSPLALTIGWLKDRGIDMIPGDGFLPACVPAVVDTWAVALARFGTMTYRQILEPAIQLAEDGFPVYEELRGNLLANARRYAELYPSTAAIYTPGGRVPGVGDVLHNQDFARTLRLMCVAEDSARHKGRAAGIEAARDVFYKGEIAERIVDFITNNPVRDATGHANAGLLSQEDFAQWRACIEEPVAIDYRGLDVHKCSSWTQGPVLLQQLSILQGFDLASMGFGSAEYLHTWVESAKLAFADREAYYGDPLHDNVPFDTLLSKEYAETRRGLIGPDASMELRPGDVGQGIPEYATFDVLADNRRAMGLAPIDASSSGSHDCDTTHLDVADSEGNMVCSVPSGGWIQSSPVIPGLGFCLGTRGQMFYLNPARSNALAPRKRPRATLTPTLVTRNRAPYLAVGAPGGDNQDQWIAQFLVNYVDFGMSLQEALDAPHFHTTHFPSSFYPRPAFPGHVALDTRFAADVVEEMKRRGHRVALDAHGYLRMKAIGFNTARGVITAGVCSNPTTANALAW